MLLVIASMKRKAFADFVARAFWRGDAFVEDEAVCGETGEARRRIDL